MNLQSEHINELMTALAKAQGQMKAALKDSNNPYYGSKYADLAGVWEVCREPLSENGLAVTQTFRMISNMESEQVLVTTLAHTSGQWIRSEILLMLPPSNQINEDGKGKRPNRIQQLCSSITYFRRYSLAAMVGVYQDDDDGESYPRNIKQDPQKHAPIVKMSETQCAEIEAWVQTFPEKQAGLLKKFNVLSIYDIPAVYFQGILNTFKAMEMNKERT